MRQARVPLQLVPAEGAEGSPASPPPPAGTALATLVGRAAEAWTVRHGDVSCTAQVLTSVAAADLDACAASGGRVLVQFVDDPRCPAVILGVVGRAREPAATSATSPPPARSASPEPAALRDMLVQGRRVTLQAGDELTLRCGQASLTLDADGRIVIKGVEIASRALRNHKIKGGTVNIN